MRLATIFPAAAAALARLQTNWRDLRQARAEERAEDRFCRALFKAMEAIPKHAHPADDRAARKALFKAAEAVVPRHAP